MVYLGLPIKKKMLFHGYVSHNQMVVIGLMFTNLANQMGTTLHLAPARTGACVDAVHVIPRGWKAHQRGVAGAAGFPGGKQCKLRKFNRGKPNSWDRVGYYPLAN